MKVKDCKTTADYMKLNQVIVCYRTDGGQIALLRKRAMSKWGFVYLYGALRPHTLHKSVFSASTAYDSMQSAQDAGRILNTFEEVSAFLTWATNKEVESIPFEPGSSYYFDSDVPALDVKAGTKVIIDGISNSSSPLVDILIPSSTGISAYKHTVNKSLLSKTPIAQRPQWQHWKTHNQVPEEEALLSDNSYQGDITMKFEMIPVLNGRNLSEVTTGELIDVIAKTEKEIDRLKNINIVSKVVKTRIEKMETNLTELVNYIDKERGEK